MSTRNLVETQRDIAAAHGRAGSQQLALASFAILALLALCFLALAPAVQPTLADRLTFLLLGLGAILCFWTPLLGYFEERGDAATFAVTLVLFLIYGLARKAGPEEGWSLTTPLLPDTPLVISYAARIIIVAAVVTAPVWWRHRNGWTRALVSAIALIAVLGAGSFWFLGRYYTVGETEVLDPTPLVHMMIQAVEFSALALACSAVCAVPATRRFVLRLLPVMMLVLWARHQFFAAPMAEEAE